jgi:hypothetical protein
MRTGDLLIERARGFLAAGMSLGQAHRRVLEEDPELARRHHLGDAGVVSRLTPDQAAPAATDPGAALMAAIGARMVAGTSREAAMREAFAAYPVLAAAYHEGRLIEGSAAAVPAAGPELVTFRLAGALVHAQATGATLKGVEVFRVGEWNGRRYTRADLAAMLDAFHQLDFRPALKVGHSDAQELAHGFATDLRIEGDSLVADFANVPEETVALIRQGRLVTVSSEIWFDLARGGKKWPRVLRAIALLGTNPPGVAGLRPLANALPAEA